jgi:hypothetical protein
VFLQEVVEVFIAARGLHDPPNYLEVETTPRAALYASHIFNPELNGSITHALVDCDASGIEHFAHVEAHLQSWRAVVAIPWLLVNGGEGSSAMQRAAQSGDQHRANFYRIRMRNNVSSCSDVDCDYGAWSATMRNPPSFHQPKFFGVLQLE